MPLEKRDVTGPGTAPTGRPSCSAKSAVVSDPERSVASTTTVAAASPAMRRLRATKHQRYGVKPGGSSETTAPRSDQLAVQAAARGRVRDVGAAREHGDGPRRPRRLGGRERADVRGGVDAEREAGDHGDARGGERAPEPAGDLDAVRRPAARADDGDAVAGGGQRGDGPGDVEHRRRVGELAQRLGIRRRRSGTRRSARRRGSPPARDAASNAACSRAIAARGVEGEQRVVGQRQHGRGRGLRRRHSMSSCAASAATRAVRRRHGVARAHAARASAWSSSRSAAAWWT